VGRTSWLARLATTGLAIALVAAGAGAGTGAARAAAPVLAAPSQVAASAGITGEFNGVAAVSPGEAWAVGYSGVLDQDAKTLIMRWNGKKWSAVTDPKPLSGVLWAVTATSADNAWAVGSVTARNGSAPRPLVMRWNGHAWYRETGVPEVSGGLNALAVSGGTVWAVGGTARKGGVSGPSLILHRTGTGWYVVPSPAPAHSSLSGVALTRGGGAWAVGFGGDSLLSADFLFRWTGTVWKRAPFPLDETAGSLYGMASGPAGAAWAVGFTDATVATYAASLRWTGTTWRNAPVDVTRGQTELVGVGAIPGGTAWAVGAVRLGPVPGSRPGGTPGTGAAPVFGLLTGDTFIVHWTGSAWSQVKSPSPDGNAVLYAVAATSARDAWAVGSYVPVNQSNPRTLIEHWNGKTWS
jgi:hypothetical protein